MQPGVRDSRPNATQRLNSAGGGVPSKPPMSWLQKPNPPSPSDSPPRSDSAIDDVRRLAVAAPVHRERWPPTVAERANSTASPSPRSPATASNTVWLYRYV